MDKQTQKLLKGLLGDSGLESLTKTMYRRDSKSILTPMDMYLPVLAVPRAILSWLVQNIKPMSINDEKTIKYPGLEDVEILVTKTGVNAYTAKFIKSGKIIHTFEDQTLPAFGGHLQSMTEDYISDEMAVPQTMMNMSGIQIPQVPQSDVAINALVEVTKVLGKVIDKIVGEKIATDAIKESKDKIEKKGMNEIGAPSGHATPAAQIAPMKPAAPSRNPKQSTFKQIAQQTKGKPKAEQEKNPEMLQHKIQQNKLTGSNHINYFRNYLQKAQLEKREAEIELTEKDLYTPCPHCMVPEFVKTEAGPKYNPCACFYITVDGKKNKSFLRLNKTEAGYKLSFSSKADPEMVEVFVETLKSKLKSKK